MSAFKTAGLAIIERAEAAVAAFVTPPPVQVVVENTDFQPLPDASFIHVAVRFTDADQVAFGTQQNRFRQYGVIVFQIVTPASDGSGLALSYADALAAEFRAKQFDGVLTFAPRVMTGNSWQGVKGNWYTTMMTVPFQYDEHF